MGLSDELHNAKGAAMGSRFVVQFIIRSMGSTPLVIRPLCRFQSCWYTSPLSANISALKKASQHTSGYATAAIHESLPQYDKDEKEDFSNITSGDPILERKLKVLQLEVEYLRQNGNKIPDVLKLEHWKSLLELETRSRRKKYLSYLFGVEKKRQNDKKKKETRRQKREKELAVLKSENVEDGQIKYGLGQNSIFMRIYDATITEFHNTKLIHAMTFGQKLVVDCSYDSFMTMREAQNCAKQLMMLFADNRLHPDPYDLHFCNVSRESVLMRTLEKFIPTLYESSFPLNVTEKSYLETFERDKLVYLTPHCKDELKYFDHDAIYIIGAMVDKVNNEPLSLAKAKRDNLKMAKLPLDRYLRWGSGASKSLTLNQMIKIMLDIKHTDNWNHALKHVPRRKIFETSNESHILKRARHVFR